MPNLKITEMNPCAEVFNADVAPIVQAGANFKATRAQLLTGGTGEDIVLTASNAQQVILQGQDVRDFVKIGAFDDITIQGALSVLIQNQGGHGTLGVFNDVEIGGQVPDHGFLNFANESATVSLILTDNPNECEFLGKGVVHITYDDGNSTEWDVAPPTEIVEAIVRLRKAVFGLLGAPIPV